MGSPFRPDRQRRIAWRWMGVGLALAFLFTLAPPLRFMGWLFGSLFHETGHVAFAWYVGCPAFPAISLTGHAAAFHKAQSPLVLATLGILLLAFAAWAWREGRLRALAFALLVAWPLFAFVDTFREVGFLLSGHLGELAFAATFLVRARTGVATETEAERPLYACLGWFLVARNVALAGGLAFSAGARAVYLHNGSFGLKNDYARIAHDVLHVSLAGVGAAMLLVSLAVVPLVLWLTRGSDEPYETTPPGPGTGGRTRREEISPRPVRTYDPTPPTDRTPSPPRRTIPISRVRPR